MESIDHKRLKQVAVRWLQKTGCVAFAMEVSFPFIGIADAAGIKRNGDLYIVEAKVSNSDMRSDMNRGKLWRLTATHKVDFIYYIVSDGVDTSFLDSVIGILDEDGGVKRRGCRFERSKNAETKAKDFMKFASACSWRAYSHVINREKEQYEFAVD